MLILHCSNWSPACIQKHVTHSLNACLGSYPHDPRFLLLHSITFVVCVVIRCQNTVCAYSSMSQFPMHVGVAEKRQAALVFAMTTDVRKIHYQPEWLSGRPSLPSFIILTLYTLVQLMIPLAHAQPINNQWLTLFLLNAAINLWAFQTINLHK